MHNLRGTYVHRGDTARRKRLVRNWLLAVGCIGAGTVAWANRKPLPANAEPAVAGVASSFFSRPGDIRKIRNELASTRGELDLLQSQFDRANKIIQFSS